LVAFSTAVSYAVGISLDSQLGYQLLHFVQLFMLSLQILVHLFKIAHNRFPHLYSTREWYNILMAVSPVT